ncbi:MAG TPA: hypothetical protein VIK64_10930 [Anaerolineales bacterium]
MKRDSPSLISEVIYLRSQRRPRRPSPSPLPAPSPALLSTLAHCGIPSVVSP